MSEPDFKTIAENLKFNNEEGEKLMKKFLVKKKLTSLQEFYATYETAVKEHSAQYTPSREPPSVQEFTETFKSLDNYPSCLHKPKKPSTPKKLIRSCGTILRGSSLALSADYAVDAYESSQNEFKSKQLDLHKNTADVGRTFSDFKQFQQQLSVLEAQLKQRDDFARKYAEQLHQLQVFGRDLEKLLPTANAPIMAFDEQEQQRLQQLLEQLQHLHFIEQNQHIFQYAAGKNKSEETLRHIVELLNVALTALQ